MIVKMLMCILTKNLLLVIACRESLDRRSCFTGGMSCLRFV